MPARLSVRAPTAACASRRRLQRSRVACAPVRGAGERGDAADERQPGAEERELRRRAERHAAGPLHVVPRLVDRRANLVVGQRVAADDDHLALEVDLDGVDTRHATDLGRDRVAAVLAADAGHCIG